MRCMKTAVRQLVFSIPDNTPAFLDIAQCLSTVNRRLYRQGYVYAVDSFVWRPAVAKADMDIICVQPSWIAYNAWVKGKALWDKMNRQSDLAYPKWHDFKVFLNAAHYVSHTATLAGGNLFPRDGAGAYYASANGDWDYSQYVSSSAGGSAPAFEKCVHFLGDDSAAANAALAADGSVSLIQGYADTRVTVGVHEPELPGDASASWQSDLFDEGETHADIDNHLEQLNDNPPYAHALDLQGGDDPIYPGGSASADAGQQLALITPIDTETVYAPGGEVPCGLLFVSPSAAGHFEIRVAPGAYNGVAAMPMEKVPT